ncbi:MAG TPA: arylsulfotransferase family protein [Solirubrobacteraceae bacterium]|nr:arylsulfotransferase family protein [Solirubrobacteraceae bacterium]
MRKLGWRWGSLGLLASLGLFGFVDRAAQATARGGSGPAFLRVIPFPGTPDASPGTAIIFSSQVPSELRSVRVTGSRTGAHRGRLEALPDGAGTEFVPGRSFTPGETVRVNASLNSPATGTAAGDRGSRQLSFSFGVAVTRSGAPPPPDAPPPPPAATQASSHSFHSEPGLHPPAVSASADPDTSSGDIFLTPAHTHQKGLMILNSRGQLVWFRRVRHAVAFNLEVQSYRRRPVLTWWQGRYGGGGQDLIADSSYHTIAALRTVGYQTDPHDFELTPQGTAWLVARTPVKASLTSVGGPSNGTVWDTVIQKVDIATGKLLWEWHAYGHIPLNASHKPPQHGFCDCYHLNAVEQLSDGNLLVSSRSTWSVYKVSVKTGQILWTLGGKYNDFKMGPGTRFEWQHDPHRVGNTLSLFDDAAQPQEEPQSSGKVLNINVAARTVKLVRRYTHNPPLLSPAQGSVQILPNGNVFVGWGSDPHFSEYSPGGRQIFSASFPLGTTSYRAFRFPWSANPGGRPDMAAVLRQGEAHVWASWNGATNIARWRVLGGSSATHLHRLETKSATGFETEMTVKSQAGYVEVQALSGHGKVLGTSALHHVG